TGVQTCALPISASAPPASTCKPAARRALIRPAPACVSRRESIHSALRARARAPGYRFGAGGIELAPGGELMMASVRRRGAARAEVRARCGCATGRRRGVAARLDDGGAVAGGGGRRLGGGARVCEGGGGTA